MKKTPDLTIVSDVGKGRSFLILFEEEAYSQLAITLSEIISAKGRAVLVNVSRITSKNWRQISDFLLECMEGLSIRQASFVAFGAAASLVQNICLSRPKLVRTAVLVDATTRPHPDMLSRFIDGLERKLPLGLPLRKHQSGFDSKPFLHRIRCPALIAVTSNSTEHQKAEAMVLDTHLPTSWLVQLSAENEVDHLRDYVLSFQDVPAKRPQKNLTGR